MLFVFLFLILKSYKVILCCSFNRDLIKIKLKYIFKDNKLLAPVVFFAELVKPVYGPFVQSNL